MARLITEKDLDAAAVKVIDSMNRLMFQIDITEVADQYLTAEQRMNQIRRFETLWRQKLR